MGHKEEMLAYASIIDDLDKGRRDEERIADFVNSLDGQGLITWFRAACIEGHSILADALEKRLRLLADSSSMNGVLLALRVG